MIHHRVQASDSVVESKGDVYERSVHINERSGEIADEVSARYFSYQHVVDRKRHV